MVRRTLACLLTLAPAGVASAAPYLNLPAATADVKAKLASGGQANIVLLGDSLSFDDTYSFRPYFTEDLQAAYGDAGRGFVSLGTERGRFGSGWTSGALNASDPAPHHGLDGLWLKALPGTPTAGDVSTFWNKVELHYVAEPGGGKVQLTLKDGAVPISTIDTNAATQQVKRFGYQFPQGVATTMTVAPDGSGPVTLLGMNLVNDQPGVRVHRASNGGWGVNQYLQRDWTFEQELGLLDTDMVMVAVGANDAATPRDEYVQKLGQLVDRLEAARPDAEIILVSPYDFGHTNLAAIAGAIEQVAGEHGVGFINLYETAGNAAFFRQNGYQSADGIHFTTEGAEYLGEFLGEAFRTNGASLPEPGAAALLLGTSAFALVRRPRRRHSESR